MNAWLWWWCFLLILQLGNADEIAVQDEERLKEQGRTENREENHQARERRDAEWFDEVLPNPENENTEQLYPLFTTVKRKPIFSRWGGQRLTDFLYKRKPAFSSWGGKRGPAFSSWGGKRSGNTSINKREDQKTHNSTNNPVIDEDNLLNTYISETGNNDEFPNEDDVYKILKNKYSDNLSKEDKQFFGKVYKIHEDPPFSAENSENIYVKKLNSFFTRNGINDSDNLVYNGIPRSSSYQISSSNIFQNENDEEPEEQDNLNYVGDTNENDIRGDSKFEEGDMIETNTLYKKASPSFNSWGGKRAPAFNSWGGKRAPAFNSWGGKRAPAFNSWGGKRAPAFNSWGGKRAPAFNSWGGKRAPAFNSWGGKRSPAFNSWGGKRTPAFNSWGGKRAPAFNSWGGKRATAFNSWGGKRAPAFNSWGGKRVPAFNSWGGKRDPAFNSWGGKRAPAFNSWGGKRGTDYDTWDEIDEETSEMPTSRRKRSPAFNSWGGKRNLQLENLNHKLASALNHFEGKQDLELENLEEKRAPAFNSWGGKRDVSVGTDDHSSDSEINNWEKMRNPSFKNLEEKRALAFNSWGGKRAPAFNSWGGKRAPAFNSWGGKRAPAFNSWGGKRAPAFNSWGGKRAPAFNSWGGKRAPAFNSWGGKRAPAFNSWGGKRAPAFNSWGGKRALAFNSWGGKRAPAFNSWGGKRAPVFTSWGGKRITGNDIDDKRGAITSWTGKRLPAFHSWGGKRSDLLDSDTLDQSDSENDFLDYYNSDNPLQLNSAEDSKNEASLTSKIIPDSENNISDEDSIDKLKNIEDQFPFLENDNLKPIENVSDKIKIEAPVQTENDHISVSKRDGEGKRNPAFFSWGGKRSEIHKQLNFLQNDDSNKRNMATTALKKIENLFASKETSLGNENHIMNKRNADFSYNSHSLPNFMISDYEGNQTPDFSSWEGEYTDHSFENVNEDTTEDLPFNIRKKRNVANDVGKLMTLITDNNNLDNTINIDNDSLSSEDTFPDIPTGTIMCCIKRVQYGDRNLFMQMLLRTKSFRDLSWPTIRPIRRGSDFYSWGGKRSSL